jgi:hypothetical protein
MIGVWYAGGLLVCVVVVVFGWPVIRSDLEEQRT